MQSEGPVERLRISGIVQFSSGLTIGGATLAGFDLPTAQRLFKKVGRLDEIAVAAKPGVPDAKLLREIEEILPSGAQVKTGSQQAQSDSEETSEFISFLQGFLLAFGGIALFVGSFVIANSLSITIAQRTREFATLRTIGATNRQILGSVMVEALVVGIVASIVGLFLGLLLAKGLFRLFDAVGFTLPNSGLVFEPRTIVVAPGRRDPRDAPGEHLPRVPRDDGSADRGRSRGRDPAGRAARSHQKHAGAGALMTALASIVAVFAITTTPGNALVSALFAVLGLILTLFGCALFPSRTLGALVSCALGFGSVDLRVVRSRTRDDERAPLDGRRCAPGVLWRREGYDAAHPEPVGLHVPDCALVGVPARSCSSGPSLRCPTGFSATALGVPADVGMRVLAFIGGALINPLILAIVLAMWLRKALSRWEPEWPAEFPGVVPDRSTTTDRQRERTA